MAMIDPNGIMPLNFFKYKGVYTGQHNGMRYMLKQTGEKPDLKLSACVWRGHMLHVLLRKKIRQQRYLN